MKKLLLTLGTILLITGCSSTPKQASADMTGINLSPTSQEYFESTHGCFGIINAHAKKEFKFVPCFGDGFKDAFKLSFSFGLAKQKIDKIDNEIFIDVFNEFKKEKQYLTNCSPTDLIRLDGIPYTVEIIYECEDKLGSSN